MKGGAATLRDTAHQGGNAPNTATRNTNVAHQNAAQHTTQHAVQPLTGSRKDSRKSRIAASNRREPKSKVSRKATSAAW